MQIDIIPMMTAARTFRALIHAGKLGASLVTRMLGGVRDWEHTQTWLRAKSSRTRAILYACDQNGSKAPVMIIRIADISSKSRHNPPIWLYMSDKMGHISKLAEIFLFFFGLSPNCFKKFSNFFFFFIEGKLWSFLRKALETLVYINSKILYTTDTK